MRTDPQLRQDVIAELMWEPTIDPREIGVHVNNGVVTLVGRVESSAEKWGVVRATQRVTNVTAVAVAINVQPASVHMPANIDISCAAENAVQVPAATPEVYFKLDAGRWVILSGDVEWVFQRRIASGVGTRNGEDVGS